ncbi:MAG: ECF transporter S component [Bacillota bacterium]|nr:ECF transporter S component [Bacillota bacterium]
MKKIEIKKLITSALLTALGILLPMAFHAVKDAGRIFLPMHIPVLICGMVCGYKFGGLCGLVTPILSSLLTGMPPIYPAGVSMALELSTYGIVSGFMRKKFNVYVSLIAAMLAGRAVSGVSNAVFMGMSGKEYGFISFLSGAFIIAIPGIIITLIIVPLATLLIDKSKVLKE